MVATRNNRNMETNKNRFDHNFGGFFLQIKEEIKIIVQKYVGMMLPLSSSIDEIPFFSRKFFWIFVLLRQ